MTAAEPRITVLGAGAWGTTMAALVAARLRPLLWAREPDVVEAINGRGENATFLPGFRLPPSLTATGELSVALEGADVVIVAVPSAHLGTAMAAARPHLPEGATVVSLAKGIEPDTLRRMSEVLATALPDHDPDAIGVLGGPNVAVEIMAGHPAAASIAFARVDRAAAIERTLALGGALRLYISDDVIGVELGGAAKNVVAIAAGVADGLGFGMNTKAALISRGLAETARLGVALGAKPITFLGLSGSGDLAATCTSADSRNRSVGEELARGAELGAITHGPAIAEGVTTAPSLLALGRRTGVEMPIAAAVTALLAGTVTPRAALDLALSRDAGGELTGLEG